MRTALERRINKFILEKNFVANAMQVVSFVVYLWMARPHMDNIRWPWLMWVAIGIFGFSTLARWFAGRRARQNLLTTKQFDQDFFLHHVFLALQVAGWGLVAINITGSYGPMSVPSMLLFVVMGGMTSAAATSLGLNKKLFISYIVGMVGFPGVLAIMYARNYSDALIATFIIMFAGFIMNTSRLFRDYLYRALESEETSHEEKEQLQSFVEAVPGFVGFFNDQLSAQNMNSLFHQVYRQETLMDAVVKFHNGEKFEETLEMEISLKGQKVWHLVNLRRTLVPESGIFVLGFSIQELKTAQQELEQQKMRAQITARMSALGEMAGGIAHEINNPLAILAGKLALMKKIIHKDDPAKMTEITESMEAVVRRIATIVKGMRSLMGDASQELPTLTDLKKMVRETVELARGRASTYMVDVRLNFDEEPFELWIRPVQMSQVILNLVNNAVYAVRDLEDRWVEINVNVLPNVFEISVTDSGSGIPAEIKDKIMDPFFTTKPPGEGTGLGLSISRNIVETHLGEFLVDENCKNTRFVVRLPLDESDSKSKAA